MTTQNHTAIAAAPVTAPAPDAAKRPTVTLASRWTSPRTRPRLVSFSWTNASSTRR